MKKRLACFILALLVLSSCGVMEDSHETAHTDIPEEAVIAKPDAGKIVTLLMKRRRSPNVSLYRIRPIMYIWMRMVKFE